MSDQPDEHPFASAPCSRIPRHRSFRGFGFAARALVGCALAGGLVVAASAPPRLAAQAGKSTLDGVFTDAQSERGAKLSVDACEPCHGEKFAGTDLGPGMVGPDFAMYWAGRPVFDLFDKISTTMPANEPGTLAPAQTADLIAYILKLNQYPAGATELPGDAAVLKATQIAAPKAAAAATGSDGAAAAGAGQGGTSTLDGVFSDAQSERGAKVSIDSCETCHGGELAGTDLGPGLVGPDFLMYWAGRPLSELFDKINATMPANDPGILGPAKSADLLAYILKLNNYPSSSTELPSDMTALEKITLAKK